MKIESKKTRIFWVVGAIISLCVCFVLCSYLFFGLHGMKQYPIFLLAAGLIALIVAAFFDSRKVMIFTVVGYIGGFALGMIFAVDGIDQGGGATNSAWKIWTVSFIVAILIGVIWELVSKHLKKKDPN